MLVQLTYGSSACHSMSPGELDDILAVSRHNNSRDGITGLLVYFEGSFLQVLEGPGDVVELTYRRILTDPRHSGVLSFIREEVAERQFGEWDMGIVVPSRALVRSLAGNDLRVENLEPSRAQRLVKSFMASAR